MSADSLSLSLSYIYIYILHSHSLTVSGITISLSLSLVALSVLHIWEAEERRRMRMDVCGERRRGRGGGERWERRRGCVYLSVRREHETILRTMLGCSLLDVVAMQTGREERKKERSWGRSVSVWRGWSGWTDSAGENRRTEGRCCCVVVKGEREEAVWWEWVSEWRETEEEGEWRDDRWITGWVFQCVVSFLLPLWTAIISVFNIFIPSSSVCNICVVREVVLRCVLSPHKHILPTLHSAHNTLSLSLCGLTVVGEMQTDTHE